MAVNRATLELIKDFEGWRAAAYPDPATGGEPITIGYGHTSAAGPPEVSMGMKLTRAEGEEILQRDLQAVERSVRAAVTAPLNENQYGALVSFTFNLGAGNLKKSTLLKKLNALDYAGAAGEFGKWNRAAGKVMAGLTRRRAAERALFLLPASVAVPPPPLPEPEDAIAPPPEPINFRPTLAGWGLLLVLAVALAGAAWILFT